MKIKDLLKFKKISDLETIEEKSFWIIAPTVAVIGLLSLTTAASYPSIWPTIFSTFFCLLFPMAMMIIVNKKKNYHSAYPMLCIFVGAVSIPMTFVFNGGFLSGMPLFCVITTAVTALCYSPKLRFASLGACVVGNSVGFAYVYLNGTPYPIDGAQIIYESENLRGAVNAIYNDVLFGYYFASIGIFVTINFIVNDIRRYKFNQDALERFFDSEKRKEILEKSLDTLSIKSEHKKAAILFADISNFTPITEKMPSDLISEFLNEFFTAAGNCIHTTGGIIDKFIGDCIMAYWLDNNDDNCVLNAVQAMLNLKLEVFRRTEQIYNKYGTELNFSVGIAYGDVIFGDIGSDTMHDYTVIGDAVNTASRIEDFAVSGEMLVSDEAAQKIKDAVILQSVESDHFFKGKNKPIDLYRIAGLKTDKEETELKVRETAGYSLHICGCRGSFPVSGLRFSEYGGETSCYVIKKGDYAVVIDCGTGLKNATSLLDGCKKIDVLLTHVHYDHILGLLMYKFPKDSEVRFFGQFAKWSREKNTLEKFMIHPYWPIEILNTEKINVELGKEVELGEDMKATFYLSDHPDQACVIKIMCKNKKIVFLADCENASLLDTEISKDSDLLFFDGMFDDKDAVNHKGWGHGTWQDAVRFLDGKNIKKLVVTHHNPELGDHSLMLREVQARNTANNVSFARSGDIYTI